MTLAPQTKSTLATLLAALVIGAAVLAVSWNGLIHPELEGLDGAHHVMDGIFFHDLFTDLPFSHLGSYPFDYYKQYPALGFIFWPPLFPAVEGVIFKIAGINLFTAQISVLLFALLLAFCMFRSGRHSLPTVPALGVTFLMLTAPGLYQYFNVVMREIPMLAMMTLTTVLYLNIVRRNGAAGTLHWQALAIAAAMSLYTKQTAFILFPAIAADLVLNHRALLRSRQSWLALVSATVSLLPLAAFTLKFGKANIEQSIGQNTQLIMSGYQGLARWSLDNWLYYVKSLPQLLHWGVLLLALAEVVCSLASVRRFRANCLWLVWLLSFYVVFSYFDNKSERFNVLVVIPLCMLAMQFVWQTLQRFIPALATGPRQAVVLVIPALCALLLPQPLQTLHGTHAIMDQFDVSKMDGNIAYWGKYRQAFVYDIRLQDRERSHHVLQAGDLLTDAGTLGEQLRDYRIRYLFVEPQSLGAADQAIVTALTGQAGITQVFAGEFRDRNTTYPLRVFRNDNPLADTMKPITLSSRLIK